MEKSEEDLEKIMQGTMIVNAKLALYKQYGFKKMGFEQQLKAENHVSKLAQYFTEKIFHPDIWERKAEEEQEKFQSKNQETLPLLLKCLQEAHMRKFQERKTRGQINDLFKPLCEESSSDEELRLDTLLHKKKCELFYEDGDGIITLQEINNCLNGRIVTL